ncbi:DNA polymerase III subunit beta family protein [Tomitella gaofuii]|uniref:DNA polymerase III subunit beta family protein n=1 Tax=Tomitella gaofuii TaxID=2760083 RepID=UPI0015FC57A2|nr:hypothetical protein [Tomitella gaofuii]
MQIRVDVKGLIATLKNTVLFAGDDDTLPMLQCARVEIIGDHLYAMATDRFRIGVNRVQFKSATNVSSGWAILVHRDDIGALEAAYKGVKRGTLATLEVNDTGMRVGVDGHAVEMNIVARDYQFPKVAQLLQVSGAHTVPTASTILNSEYLADFKKARRSTGDMVEVTFPDETNKPVRITIRDYFVGLIMPVRLSNQGEEMLEALGVTA